MKVCNDFYLLINLYIDGELEGEEACAVEKHLQSCPACRRYCDEICLVNRAVRDIDYPQNLHGSIMEAVGKEMERGKVIDFPGDVGRAAKSDQISEKTTERRKPRRKRRWIGTVAAMLAVALVGAFGMENGLSFIRRGIGTAQESADTAVMETEVYTTAEEDSLVKDMDAKRVGITAESAPETPETMTEDVLPIRIEETMTGWFIDAADHVTVIDEETPMRQSEPEDSVENSAGATEKGGDIRWFTKERLEWIDLMLGEAADGYGFYLMTAGNAEALPAVFADQAEDAGVGYILVISVRNDEEVKAEIAESMAKSGFEVYEDVEADWFVIDTEAEEGLVIVELTE